uniref:Uncharacterized protein n=1 Tax=Glossina brevipalpis TaxID=37001 RepID=A0A1A9WIW7_9MUSC
MKINPLFLLSSIFIDDRCAKIYRPYFRSFSPESHKQNENQYNYPGRNDKQLHLLTNNHYDRMPKVNEVQPIKIEWTFYKSSELYSFGLWTSYIYTPSLLFDTESMLSLAINFNFRYLGNLCLHFINTYQENNYFDGKRNVWKLYVSRKVARQDHFEKGHLLLLLLLLTAGFYWFPVYYLNVYDKDNYKERKKEVCAYTGNVLLENECYTRILKD